MDEARASKSHPKSPRADKSHLKISQIRPDFTLLFLLEHIYLPRTLSYHSQTCFNNISRIYLNEKLNFYHHILVRNSQMYIRLENLAC